MTLENVADRAITAKNEMANIDQLFLNKAKEVKAQKIISAKTSKYTVIIYDTHLFHIAFSRITC
jgi:hypothetical protein